MCFFGPSLTSFDHLLPSFGWVIFLELSCSILDPHQLTPLQFRFWFYSMAWYLWRMWIFFTPHWDLLQLFSFFIKLLAPHFFVLLSFSAQICWRFFVSRFYFSFGPHPFDRLRYLAWWVISLEHPYIPLDPRGLTPLQYGSWSYLIEWYPLWSWISSSTNLGSLPPFSFIIILLFIFSSSPIIIV